MAVYYTRDIQSGNTGDLVIGANGDIVIGDSLTSHRHALKFMLATDNNELGAQPDFGSNIGTLIGASSLSDVLSQIENLVAEGVINQGVLAPSDLDVTATPVSPTDVYLRFVVLGQFVDDDGDSITPGTFTLRFLFPYKDGELEALDL